MTPNSLLVKQYAVVIYVHGSRDFTSVIEGYVEPVKEFASTKYTADQILNAFNKGYITESEYNETMAYVKPVEE